MTNKNLGDTLKDNQQAMIHKKEEYYDKLIRSLHLSTVSIDIIIVSLILLVVVIFVTQAK